MVQPQHGHTLALLALTSNLARPALLPASQRRVSLADTTAEAKLGQLASALTLFIESDA